MTCKEIVDLFVDFCGGDLPAEHRALLEQHLCCCPPCQTYFETYQITIKLSRRLTCKPMPDQLAAKMHAVVEAMRQEQSNAPTRNC